MKRLIALLPVLIAFQAGAPPALAWTWPVDGPVLEPFALGDDPYAAGQHRGLDVGAATGSRVRAPATGTVRFAGTVPGGGRTVTVLSEDGYAVTLLHLGAIAVTDGASVAEGSTVGTVGPSGDAEHPRGYVHLGVRIAEDPNGYLDPLGFLPAREGAPPPAPPPPEQPGGREEPPPAPAPVEAPAPDEAPAPAPAEPVEPSPVARPAAASAPTPAPAPTAERSARWAPSRAGEGAPGPGPAFAQTPGRPAVKPGKAAVSEHEARPGLPRPTTVRVDGPSVHEAASASSPSRSPTPVRRGSSATPPAVILGAAALLGVALVTLRFVMRRLRGGQLGHARPAHAPAPMLADGARRPAEHARRPRPAEDDRLVPHRDLEWIPLGEPKALADLDGDHDPAELVEVPDDAGRRLAATVIANPRAHRVRRHQSSRRRRPERLVCR
jgi:hypothetical protein